MISQARSHSTPVDVDQQAHQFGDADRRMGVVELDRDLFRERVDVAVLLEMAADQVLQRGGGEEIFLPQPQFLAGRRGIARDRGPWKWISART